MQTVQTVQTVPSNVSPFYVNPQQWSADNITKDHSFPYVLSYDVSSVARYIALNAYNGQYDAFITREGKGKYSLYIGDSTSLIGLHKGTFRTLKVAKQWRNAINQRVAAYGHQMSIGQPFPPSWYKEENLSPFLKSVEGQNTIARVSRTIGL